MGAIVNVVYAEKNWVYEELLKNPSSCFLQCLSIEGHEKDEKKCKELNDKVESLIRVLSERQSLGKNCYNKRVKACCEESSQLNEEFKEKKKIAYDNVSCLWKDAFQYPPLLSFGV